MVNIVVDDSHERDFDELIRAFIYVGSKLDGSKNPIGTKNLFYAEGLEKKLHHAITVEYIGKGYKLSSKEVEYEPQIDFASACILTRAALETYLTFNHIFITAKSEAEHELRFKTWDFAGYKERLKYF